MTTKEWRTSCLLASMDLVNQLMSKTGLIMTGPATYMIINSSGMLWTVALSVLVLGKRPTRIQLIGVAFVFAGLGLKVYDSIRLDAAEAQDKNLSLTELYGICMI